MEVRAKLRHLKMSPRKVRLVADTVRGLDVLEAQNQLSYSKKHAARPLLKLLNSAIANAKNNFELDQRQLFIKELLVDMGPTLNRWRARAYGRAAPIRKRSSHILIVLSRHAEDSSLNKKTDQKRMDSEKRVIDSLPDSVKLTKKKGKEEFEFGSVETRVAKDLDINEEVKQSHKPHEKDSRMKGKHRSTQHLDTKSKKISIKNQFKKQEK